MDIDRRIKEIEVMKAQNVMRQAEQWADWQNRRGAWKPAKHWWGILSIPPLPPSSPTTEEMLQAARILKGNEP